MAELYIGVMSGTSLDGIDVALCEIDDSKCALIHSLEYPFPKQLKKEILNTISNAVTLQEIGILNIKLGNIFSDSINTLLQANTINPTAITAIGLHGQTLWHEPNNEFPFSMQLGCPNVVATQTNIQTVADFRNMDVSNGGQGAPFAPAFHEFLFKTEKTKTAILNIGGMANLTLIKNPLRGWDIGCGNVLLDYWAERCKGVSYDKEGAFAKSGQVNQNLLQKMLKDTFFERTPPKSTGREYFNATWLNSYLRTFQTIKDEDMQRTLLELVAQSITNDIKSTDIQTIIVCGGGTKNSFLMQRLRELNSCLIHISDDIGVSSDYMEAMAFAWLAYKRIQKEEVNLSSVTGAHKNSILGGIYG